MNVLKYYHEKISTQGAMLFSLIDPDKMTLDKGAKIAKQSYDNGADVILVGGSIGAQGSVLDETVKMIKEAVSIPVVLYPGSPGGLTKEADAVYFMHMLNSRDVYWLATAQIQAAPVVKRMGLQAIPTTYLIVEPGRTVGWIGNANVVPRERSDLAAACALTALYTGSKVLITDAGSGAPQATANEMIAAIAAQKEDMYYFNGGGIRTPEAAADCIKYGADGVQVGNVFEEISNVDKIKKIAEAVHKEGKKKI